MIKNQKQAALIKEQITELKNAKAEFQKSIEDNNSIKYEFGVDSFDSLIADNEAELKTYEDLTNRRITCLPNQTLEDISNVFISARLAQNLSQKDLAEKIGIQEQQIQRYETGDYESASLVRLLEVAHALDINLKFNEIPILGCKVVAFAVPSYVSSEEVYEFEESVRLSHSLIGIQ